MLHVILVFDPVFRRLLLLFLSAAASAQPVPLLTETQRIAPDAPVQGADFGRRAHVLSGLAVFGAVGDTARVHWQPGAAYVFDRDPATGDFLQTHRIAAPAFTNNEDFGGSLAIATDNAGEPLVLAIGDRAEDGPAGHPDRMGAVYFYERGAGGTWEPTGRFTTGVEVAQVGGDLRVDAAGGTRFIVTAQGPPTQSAFVLEQTPGGDWESTATLVPDLPTPTGRPLFIYPARAVLSGTVAVASETAAYYDPEGDRRASALHVFEQDPTGVWAYAARLQPPPQTVPPPQNFRDTRFGRSLALAPHGRYGGDGADAPLLVTSAAYEIPYGGVFVYERSPAGDWIRTATLLPADIAPGDQFGTEIAAVAQVGGGILVAASSRGADVGEAETGAVYAFFQAAPGAPWVEVAKLIKSGPPERHLNFGEDGVAVSPVGEVVVASNRETVVAGEEPLRAAGASYRYDLRAYLPVSSEPPGLSAPGITLSVWPNPAQNRAASRARVSLRVDRPTHMRVTVVDALGREVAVLHEGLVTGDVAWRPPPLPSGVYAVRASGPWGHASTRMTIVE